VLIHNCLNHGAEASIDVSIVFRAPFDDYSGEQILKHYKTRQSIRLFPVFEPDQVKPAFVDDVLKNCFTFNGEMYHLGCNIDWKNNPSSDIEWLILLHKGYYLVGLGMLFRASGGTKYLNKWVRLVDSWIDQTAPDFIASDVTGRRIQNWIYALYYFINGNPHGDPSPKFVVRLLASLRAQVEYLISNLTPARNHRTLELYAIFLAAVWLPELRGADRWLDFAVNELADNAASDILPDGVHCELSTFYHHIVLKNFLAAKRLAEANSIQLPTRFDEAVKRALNFSLYIHKPDGRIPSLSDGDTGSFCDLLDLGAAYYDNESLQFVSSSGALGSPPSQRSRSFTHSGYSVLRSSWKSDKESFKDARYLVFDCGPLGAGNHGHFDLLNIEMAAYGRSLIVDPGRFTYDESGTTNWRALFRSTRYHNTVSVDGKDQVGYRYNSRRGKYKIYGDLPKAKLLNFVTQDSFDFVRGIARSPQYTATHERLILFVQGEYWLVSDVLRDSKSHDYCLHYHLAPQPSGQPQVRQESQSIRVEASKLALILPSKPEAETHIGVGIGFISPIYGVKCNAPIVDIGCIADNTTFNTVLYPYKSALPNFTVDILDAELSAPQSLPWEASAFSLRIENGEDWVTDFFFISHNGIRREWRFRNFHCSGTFCFLRLNAGGYLMSSFTDSGTIVVVDEPAAFETGRIS